MFLEKGKPFKLSEVEENVLKFWKKEDIFRKSLNRRRNKKPFIFYEGPPYANGFPGIHHVLARTYKDIILRFRSMRGFYVYRRAGWDTHGLPVEMAAEKKLGLKTKKDVEKFGVARFNEEAKRAVWLYKDEWENLTNRIGYWLDLENAYVTYKNEYIESLWWIIKKIWDRNLLFQGKKVVPWCIRCGTALSSHELAQGYKEVKDQSAFIKFKLKPHQRIGKNFSTNDTTYILAWTTTPWTIPGNVALAIGEKIKYIRISRSFIRNGKKIKEHIILAKEIFDRELLKTGTSDLKDELEKFLQEDEFPGSSLIGFSYIPIFQVRRMEGEKSYKIYSADFVTTTDGTGVVHIAPMYGEDDYRLGLAEDLPLFHTVDESGKFVDELKELAGMVVGEKETEEKLFNIFKRENIFAINSHDHEYPHCWRCGTPIIYYARISWFIKISALRKELLAQNKKVNWYPGHIKEGRFGEWLKEAKDWNLSRERFWGTPLPIWQCDNCHETKVIGSMDELAENAVLPNFIFVRHGEATHNIEGIVAPIRDTEKYTSRLTDRGQQRVKNTARILKNKGIDRIISSSLIRAKETAIIISEATGAPVEIRDDIVDIDPGNLSGASEQDFRVFIGKNSNVFDKQPPGGESRNQVMARMVKAWKEISMAYPGEKIVLVSHGDPLYMLKRALESIPDNKINELPYPKKGEIYPIDIKAVSLNDLGYSDLHRPFIDAVRITCPSCDRKMARIPEVADVWFDSGAMPFAQLHYPFENKELIDRRKAYPADYIAEAMDQTRGWFYTLLATATALGFPVPYKNVISLGLINDKFGQKMSKSKGNIIKPESVIDAFGVDAVRWYFYTATDAGETKNFDEQEVIKAARRYHLVILNSWIFCDTYSPKNRNFSKKIGKKKSVLDKWIVARLEESISVVTNYLDHYDIRQAGIELEKFVDDFSRWYIRRSRRRLQKPISQSDYKESSETLGQVLYVLTLMTAPFTPFFAEYLFHMLEPKKEKESVHFLDWPKNNKKRIDKKLIKEMAETRRLAAIALSKRAELGIKVRQPLSTLKIKSQSIKIRKELLEILKDEVNVKRILNDAKLKEEIWLDPEITESLRKEGTLRELSRYIQDLRQKAGLQPKDWIIVGIEAEEKIKEFFKESQKIICKEVRARRIIFNKLENGMMNEEVEIPGMSFLGIKKV